MHLTCFRGAFAAAVGIISRAWPRRRATSAPRSRVDLRKETQGALVRSLTVSSGVVTAFDMTLTGLAVDDEIAVAVGVNAG